VNGVGILVKVVVGVQEFQNDGGGGGSGWVVGSSSSSSSSSSTGRVRGRVVGGIGIAMVSHAIIARYSRLFHFPNVSPRSLAQQFDAALASPTARALVCAGIVAVALVGIISISLHNVQFVKGIAGGS